MPCGGMSLRAFGLVPSSAHGVSHTETSPPLRKSLYRSAKLGQWTSPFSGGSLPFGRSPWTPRPTRRSGARKRTPRRYPPSSARGARAPLGGMAPRGAPGAYDKTTRPVEASVTETGNGSRKSKPSMPQQRDFWKCSGKNLIPVLPVYCSAAGRGSGTRTLEVTGLSFWETSFGGITYRDRNIKMSGLKPAETIGTRTRRTGSHDHITIGWAGIFCVGYDRTKGNDSTLRSHVSMLHRTAGCNGSGSWNVGAA
jgi:hypothetical protein